MNMRLTASLPFVQPYPIFAVALSEPRSGHSMHACDQVSIWCLCENTIRQSHMPVQFGKSCANGAKHDCRDLSRRRLISLDLDEQVTIITESPARKKRGSAPHTE